MPAILSNNQPGIENNAKIVRPEMISSSSSMRSRNRSIDADSALRGDSGSLFSIAVTVSANVRVQIRVELGS